MVNPFTKITTTLIAAARFLVPGSSEAQAPGTADALPPTEAIVQKTNTPEKLEFVQAEAGGVGEKGVLRRIVDITSKPVELVGNTAGLVSKAAPAVTTAATTAVKSGASALEGNREEAKAQAAEGAAEVAANVALAPIPGAGLVTGAMKVTPGVEDPVKKAGEAARSLVEKGAKGGEDVSAREIGAPSNPEKKNHVEALMAERKKGGSSHTHA